MAGTIAPSAEGGGGPRTPRFLAALDRWKGLWPLGMLAVFLAIVAPSLDQPLLETYAYRQTQTAYTAVLYAQNGVDLLRPPLPVLGKPGILPLEFPLFQWVGATLIAVGAAPDFAMRLTGLVFFVASAGLVYALARYVIGALGAAIALGAFIFNGHALIYSRTSLIEYLATAAGLAAMLCAIRWLDRGGLHLWSGALIAGSVAALVKVTTAPLFLLPVLAWRSGGIGHAGVRRPGLWLLLLLSAGVGLMWNGYADAIRASYEGTEFLAAQNQLEWLLGTPLQRLDLGQWRVPTLVILSLTGSAALIWAPLAVRFATWHSQSAFLLVLLSASVLPILVFFNLYARHEYYYAAIAPLLAVAIGMGGAQLARLTDRRRRRLLTVGLAGAWIATIVGLVGSWSVIYGSPKDEPRVRAAVNFIRHHSDPDDWIVIDGYGWNSTLLYYSRRPGYAVPGTDNLLEPGEVDVDRILEGGDYGPLFTCDAVGRCSVSSTP